MRAWLYTYDDEYNGSWGIEATHEEALEASLEKALKYFTFNYMYERKEVGPAEVRAMALEKFCEHAIMGNLETWEFSRNGGPPYSATVEEIVLDRSLRPGGSVIWDTESGRFVPAPVPGGRGTYIVPAGCVAAGGKTKSAAKRST